MPVNKFGVTTDAYGNRIRSGGTITQSGGSGGGVSQTYVDTNFMRRDGSSSFTGDVSMNNHKIENLQAPAPGASDDTAATKGYVDQSIADETASIFQTAGQTYLSRVNGGSVGGAINMNGNNITGLPSVPTFTSAASSKAYVDNQTTATLQNVNNTFLRKDGANAMTGNLNADSFRITNLPVPQDDADAINTTYADSRYLKLDGTGVMTGPLNVGFQTIENVQPPTTENQPATKGYVDTEITKSLTLNSNFLAELSNEVEVTSSAAYTPIAPWSVIRTEGNDISIATANVTSDTLSISGQATVTVTTTYRLPSAALAPRLDCIFSFASGGVSIVDHRVENQTAGTYTFTISLNKESDGVETYNFGVLNSNRRFFVETTTQVEVFGSGGQYVKTSEFNLTEEALESGTLPLGNGSVTLQDSPEGKNKMVFTLSSPSQGLMQFTVYPNLLDVAMTDWVFNVGGPITVNGTNHKNVSFAPGDDFQITSIAGR
ncbi:MAG: hypothetical protein MI700_14480 [Balneolales bacterium]|nr:hypothetical protein [Balneolales bacterium]